MTEKEMFINMIKKFTECPLWWHTEKDKKNIIIIANDNGDEIEFEFDDSGNFICFC